MGNGKWIVAYVELHPPPQGDTEAWGGRVRLHIGYVINLITFLSVSCAIYLSFSLSYSVAILSS